MTPQLHLPHDLFKSFVVSATGVNGQVSREGWNFVDSLLQTIRSGVEGNALNSSLMPEIYAREMVLQLISAKKVLHFMQNTSIATEYFEDK